MKMYHFILNNFFEKQECTIKETDKTVEYDFRYIHFEYEKKSHIVTVYQKKDSILINLGTLQISNYDTDYQIENMLHSFIRMFNLA